MTNHNIDVSIVIVCMNNLKNLYPCLDSILACNKEEYTIYVVAYLFSKSNFDKIRQDYPFVTIVESNEIRGFSENNNLALKLVHTPFCLVLNDDTYFSGDMISGLRNTFLQLPQNVAVVSPSFYNEDGSIQSNGRPPFPLIAYFLESCKISYVRNSYKRFIAGKGIYETYNLSGACFLIKTQIFKSMGFFDERFFFCPEDIALSKKLNDNGFKCYVNADVKIIHKGGQSSNSFIKTAIYPAKIKGDRTFYCEDSVFKNLFFILNCLVIHFFCFLGWFFLYLIRKKEFYLIKYLCHYHTLLTVASKKMPKQIFIKYYIKK